MAIETISAKLEYITDIVRQWQSAEISDIEKDTVLENLRTVYSDIKFLNTCQRVPEDIFTSQDNVNNTASNSFTDISLESVNAADEVPVENFGGNDSFPDEVLTPSADAVTIEDQVILTDDNAMDREFAETVDSVQQSCTPPQEALFEEHEIPVKPKLDRKVLLSLYGDDTPKTVSTQEQVSPAFEKVEKAYDSFTDEQGSFRVEKPLETHYASQQDQADVYESKSEPANTHHPLSENQKVVLGDVINSEEKTLSDAYASQNNITDVATAISSSRVTELRKSIGINDKFLLIRDLFNGDSSEYDSVMSRFEEFDSLDDALIFIHENYGSWNPNSEGLKLLMELLTRKLS